MIFFNNQLCVIGLNIHDFLTFRLLFLLRSRCKVIFFLLKNVPFIIIFEFRYTANKCLICTRLDPSEVATKESVQWDAGVAPSNEDPDDGYHDNSLIQPSSIFQVCEDVVKSQVALIPGIYLINI